MKIIIKKVLMIVTIYIGLILISTNVYAKSGKISTETTRLRKESTTNSDIISLISQDEEVEIIGEEGDWYKVKYSNHTGYVRKDMISVEKDASNENANSKPFENNETQTEEKTDGNTKNEQENENTVLETSSEIQAEQNTQTENNIDLQIGYTGKLKSNLDIRILPLINSSVILTINENTEFKVTDIINKWCYIETENNSGWVLVNKVKNGLANNTMQTSAKPEDKKEDNTVSKSEENKDKASEKSKENTTITKYVKTETLNVRESTDNSAKIITQLTLNTKVTVLEVVDSTWSKIKVKEKTGYVASKYLSDTKIEASSRSEEIVRKKSNLEQKNEENNNSKENSEKKEEESNSQSSSKSEGTGSDIVSFAKKYLGYKYVSGGTLPSTGFDCSGFTYYVYKNFGITLSRTSTAQATNGRAVSKSELQAGDLVIFNNSSNSAIGHVGIYIGGNTFIHAANAQKGIITTSLSDGYYSSRFVTARRIIN